MAAATFSGGKKLKEFLKNAGKGGIKGVDVGIFKTAKYPDGTLVAAVAAWNEFGTRFIPERPALRIANKANEKIILQLIKKKVDPKIMVITQQIGGLIGANHQGAMQRSIVALREPSNKAATIKRKGTSNPLVAKGTYKNSITFKVIP